MQNASISVTQPAAVSANGVSSEEAEKRVQDLQANLTREKQNNTMLSTQVISLTNKLADKDV